MKLTILPNNTNGDMVELTTSDSRGRRTLWAVAHAGMFADDPAIARRLYDGMPCVVEVRLSNTPQQLVGITSPTSDGGAK